LPSARSAHSARRIPGGITTRRLLPYRFRTRRTVTTGSRLQRTCGQYPRSRSGRRYLHLCGARRAGCVDDARQVGLLALLGCGARQPVDEPDITRHHEARDALCDVVEERANIQLAAAFQLDIEENVVLAQFGRHRNGGRRLDVRVLVSNRFELYRRDVLAAHADRILEAAEIVEVAVGVPGSEIAGVEPVVTHGACGCGPIAEVPCKQSTRILCPNGDFARDARCARRAVLSQYGDVEARNGPADGTDATVGNRVERAGDALRHG